MKLVTVRVGKLQTNCYILVNAGNAAVIDPGGDAEVIMMTLAQENAQATLIVLTHGHADHVAGAMDLRRRTNAPILIHEYDLPYLRATDDEMAIYLGLQESIIPTGYLAEGQPVTLAGVEFAVIETPGHTPGSCCLYSAEQACLLSGDTLFASSIGRSDLTGGDRLALANSLNRLKELPIETKVYPGHGSATTIGAERVRNRYW